MVKKMNLLATIIASQFLLSPALQAVALLDPLELAPLKSHASITPKQNDFSENTPSSQTSTNNSAVENLQTGLLYTMKTLGGLAASIFYSQYLSTYNLPEAFKSALPFGAAVLGYTLPDVLDSMTGFTQKPNAPAVSFTEMLGNSATYAGNYLLSVTADGTCANLAYYGVLYGTGNILFAEAASRGAKNLTFYTGVHHKVATFVKETSTNAFKLFKRWWSK